MKRAIGRPVLGGLARGPALFTDTPVNFTAGFTKPPNLLPWKRSQFCDRHHPWCGMNLKGTVLFLPACIGSTYTGLVLLDLVRLGRGPVGMVVEDVDPLLVSGAVVSEVWYGRGIPIVACDIGQFRGMVRPGVRAEVNGDTGEIVIQD